MMDRITLRLIRRVIKHQTSTFFTVLRPPKIHGKRYVDDLKRRCCEPKVKGHVSLLPSRGDRRAHLLTVALDRLAIHARHSLDPALAPAGGKQRLDRDP